MADALQRRGWENDYFCPLYVRSLETPMHLPCPWVRKVWIAIGTWSKVQALHPYSWGNASSLDEWLRTCRLTSQTTHRKGAQSLLLLAAWEIWSERIRRVFQKQELTVEQLVLRIPEGSRTLELGGSVNPF
jgi:hypothetical protein